MSSSGAAVGEKPYLLSNAVETGSVADKNVNLYKFFREAVSVSAPVKYKILICRT